MRNLISTTVLELIFIFSIKKNIIILRTYLAKIFDGLDFVQSSESRSVERNAVFVRGKIIGWQPVARYISETGSDIFFKSV